MSNNNEQSGFALILVITLLIPVMIAVAAFTSVMVTRSNEMQTGYSEELALLTAEAGVDEALYMARAGTLTAGVPTTRSFGPQRSFTAMPTYLKTDGQDNDKDGNIDEADEDVYQIVVSGTYRNTTRRLATYVGIVPTTPPSFAGALATMDPAVNVDTNGTMRFSGFNRKMDGSLVGTGDQPGLAIGPPGTVAHLASELSVPEASQVVGSGGTPSLGTSPTVDVASMVAQVKNSADIVLTSATGSDLSFGNGLLGQKHVTYREGNLMLNGTSQGAGVLVVTGDLTLNGTFRFDGVIIVLGKIRAIGTAQVYGSIVQGPSGGEIWSRGTFDVHYSTAALALANSLGGYTVSYNGWQELSRK